MTQGIFFQNGEHSAETTVYSSMMCLPSVTEESELSQHFDRYLTGTNIPTTLIDRSRISLGSSQIETLSAFNSNKRRNSKNRSKTAHTNHVILIQNNMAYQSIHLVLAN